MAASLVVVVVLTEVGMVDEKVELAAVVWVGGEVALATVCAEVAARPEKEEQSESFHT